MKLDRVCICVISMALSWAAHAATTRERAAGNAVSYVFASELGSGIYDLSGRSLQVYRFAPDWRLQETSASMPGVRLVAPLTFGFLDFNPVDVIGNGLPTHIDSFSITPGIELEFPVRDGWLLIPYLRAGASVASGGVYGIADFLLDPPAVPVAPATQQSWQFEAGIMLGTRPLFRIWRFDAPRIGLGYRLAGEFSGWRLAIGTPF
jgi:hypothetical protein